MKNEPATDQSSTPSQQPKRRRANDPSRKTEKEEFALPIAIETEQALIGFLFLGPEHIPQVVEAGFGLQLLHVPSHRIIYSAMVAIVEKNWTLNPKTLTDYLNSQHAFEKIGGHSYLAQLMEVRAIGPSSLSGLVQQLKDVDYKRQVVKQAIELQRVAGNGSSPTEIEEAIEGLPRTHSAAQSYSITPAGLIHRRPARIGFGYENERLTNFSAKILTEVIKDDGSAEEQRLFELEVTLKAETRKLEVTAAKFDSMAWVTEQLGAGAIIFPGKAPHAQCAIKSLSPSFAQRTVYAHTGWRFINDEWVYLHGGGALTANGNRTDISVRLPHSMRHFAFPDSATKNDCAGAYQAALDLLRAFPLHLTAPMLGAVWASVLGIPDYSIYVTGQSGCFKSEITGIVMSFFGAGFNRLQMPANWDDTANALLSKTFTVKDAILVIDDFAPNGQRRHDDELHAKAERVFRAAGNRTGRSRLQSDITERAAKEPRGLLLSSGEDVPRGNSLQNRLLIVPIEKGMITSDALTKMQKLAADGRLALSLATFLSYIAGMYEKIKGDFEKTNGTYRDKLVAQIGGHARQPTTAAHLAAAWGVWLKAASSARAITEEDAAILWKRIWKTLAEAGLDQREQQGSLHPVDHFIELLRSALISGRANLQTITGDQPAELGKLCGWRNGQPTGECVGWIDGESLYLEFDAAYGVANQQGVRNGEGLAVMKRTLVKRLDERQLILFKEGGRGYRCRVPGLRIPAIAIPLDTIFSPEEAESDK